MGQAPLPPGPSADPHGSAQREEQESTQREAITSLLLRLFTTCPAKPPRISVPSHPHLSAENSRHRRSLRDTSGIRRKRCFNSTLLKGHGVQLHPSRAEPSHPPCPAEGHPGQKSRGEWGSDLSRSGGSMRHLAVPRQQCGNAVRSPSPSPPAGLPFNRGRKGTIAIQGLPGSRPPQIRAV